MKNTILVIAVLGTIACGSGSTGPSGSSGGAGSAGLAGSTGPAGPAGAAGSPGAAGPAGVAGPVGLAGPAGAVGPTGPAGATGAAGTIGATGATGAAGAMGATGATGIVVTYALDYNVGIPFPANGGISLQFLGPTTSITTTAVQRLTASIGTSFDGPAAGTAGPGIALCYQNGGGPIQPFTQARTYALVPSGARVPATAVGSVVPGAGTFNVGLCGGTSTTLQALGYSGYIVLTN